MSQNGHNKRGGKVMRFDIEGARKAGYSEGEIADYMGSQNNFDVGGARRSGYADSEIITHLSVSATPPQPETSWLQNTAIGIGKGMTDIGTGALQRVLEGGEAIRSAVGMESNQPNIDRLKAIAEENKQAFAPLKDQSTAANVGEFIGQVAPTVMIPGGVAGGALKRAGTSALSGAATGYIQPTTGDESAIQNAAMGGVMGAGLVSCPARVRLSIPCLTGSPLTSKNPLQSGTKSGPRWERQRIIPSHKPLKRGLRRSR
jgi:hypothetical protein